MTDATLPQGIKVLNLISQEKPDPRGFAQNLISNWGAIQVIGRGVIDQATFEAAVKEVVNPFAEEKEELRWFYPDGWKPTTVEGQLAILQEVYVDLALNGSHVEGYAAGITVPEAADGLFVVPKPSSIAAKLGITVDPLVEGYGQLLEGSLLDRLEKQRKFKNYRAGQLTPDRVRMRQSAADEIRKLEAEQPEGDFLVFPAQTGMKWGGYSPQNARWDIEHKSENEFPLPAWCVGHILLTNPGRLEAYEILWIDCPGDEYRFEGEVGFGRCLYVRFVGGRLEFCSRWLRHAYDSCGSASGFSG
ncbi:MAG: hypothetical protein WD187_02720 [Candidatus Woykebacteria bacterium]